MEAGRANLGLFKNPTYTYSETTQNSHWMDLYIWRTISVEKSSMVHCPGVTPRTRIDGGNIVINIYAKVKTK